MWYMVHSECQALMQTHLHEDDLDKACTYETAHTVKYILFTLQTHQNYMIEVSV